VRQESLEYDKYSGEGFMKNLSSGLVRRRLFGVALALSFALVAGIFTARLAAQDDKSTGAKSADSDAPTQNGAGQGAPGAPAYSGMYTFRKEGEFVQLTVEDNGNVTGFISRFRESESDKSAFLDQFFKTAKLDGNKLSFSTAVVQGVSFDFKGSVVRGEGKNPGDEAYFVLQGTLTENASDANKKVTSHSQDVAFKMFPQDASSEPAAKN
jgi:hypothetical protein